METPKITYIFVTHTGHEQHVLKCRKTFGNQFQLLHLYVLEQNIVKYRKTTVNCLN